MPPVDPKKIEKFLEDWNTNLGRTPESPLWIEVQGVSSLMEVMISEDGEVSFYPNRGYLVKGFLNKETGEVKTFTIQLFSKQN